jgi:hypothetical protein
VKVTCFPPVELIAEVTMFCERKGRYAWLKDHLKDFLTLSKLFWHSSPNEVIKTYGGRFNESSGVCSMEAWLDEREVKREA